VQRSLLLVGLPVRLLLVTLLLLLVNNVLRLLLLRRHCWMWYTHDWRLLL
jgi:hypothetical protein